MTVEPLTPRGAVLFTLAAQGLNNHKIVGKLGIFTVTVKDYFGHIFSKMEVRPRTEALI